MLGANIGLFFTIIAWGSTAPVINELLKQTDPIILTAARFILTSIVFGIWLKLAESNRRVFDAVPWRQIMFLGLILTGFTVLFTYAIRFSNPINVSIIVAAGPVVASLVNWMLTGNRPQKAVYMAIPLAVVGGIVASVDFRSLMSGKNGLLFEGGEIFMLLGIFLWSFYSALLQRWCEGMSQLRRTALTFIGSTPMLIIIAGCVMVAGIEGLPALDFDARYVSFFVWSSLATSILGTYLWNIGVLRLGIVVATMFLNLIPIVAILVSMMFGIEPRLEQFVGGLLVIAAVGQAQWRTMALKKQS